MNAPHLNYLIPSAVLCFVMGLAIWGLWIDPPVIGGKEVYPLFNKVAIPLVLVAMFVLPILLGYRAYKKESGLEVRP